MANNLGSAGGQGQGGLGILARLEGRAMKDPQYLLAGRQGQGGSGILSGLEDWVMEG